jgi:hypothetical protein
MIQDTIESLIRGEPQGIAVDPAQTQPCIVVVEDGLGDTPIALMNGAPLHYGTIQACLQWIHELGIFVNTVRIERVYHKPWG